MTQKKFGAKRAGTGTVDETASNSLRWATSAASQMRAASAVVALNVKRIPVRYIREDELNPRKLVLSSAEVFDLARRFPIDQERLQRSDDGYLDDYLERVETEAPLSGKAVADFQSIASFAFALKSADRLMHPIVVWQNDTQFHLIAGERRLLAHILLGEATIDARIRDSAPDMLEKYLLQWEENIHRDDLSLFEKIDNLRQLMEAWKAGRGVQSISVNQFAALSGLPRSVAQRYLAVIRCPSPLLLAEIEAGRVTNIQQAARIAAMPVADIEALLSSRKTPKPAGQAGGVTSVRVGRARDYRAVSFLIKAAVEKLDDQRLTAQLDRLDLARQKDLNRAFEILLARIEELKVDG
jgi:ParB-like chromosome segregation protein Spo0J